MPFGSENVKPASSNYFVVLFVGLQFVALEYLVPLLGRHDILIPRVVPDRALGLIYFNLNLALRCSERLRDSLLHALLFGHEFGIATEQDVGTAACHVGGDRDHVFAAGLRDDLGFTLVILGIENYVLNSLLLEQFRKPFRFFD